MRPETLHTPLAAAPGGDLLVVDDLTLRYQPDAPPMCFDLRVARGECLALIGPSGAGKSTLLSLIAGFVAPDAGRVLIDGRDVTRLAPADRPVTTVFQDHNLFAHLNVASNVGLGIHPGLKLNAAQRERVRAALASVGLDGLETRLPARLSGGQQQRVVLARALVRDRPLLLLDEPFAALGPSQRAEMLALLDELRRASGLTVLLVSHHPQDAARAAARTAFMHDGRVLAVEASARLLRRTDLPALRDYLGDELFAGVPAGDAPSDGQ